MKIVLDTNAFYYALGKWDKSNFGNNTKVNQDKFDDLISDKNNHNVISTATLFEFLVRFRNNPQFIRKGLSFIKDNINQSYIDMFLPLEMNDIAGLLALSDGDISKKLIVIWKKRLKLNLNSQLFFLD